MQNNHHKNEEACEHEKMQQLACIKAAIKTKEEIKTTMGMYFLTTIGKIMTDKAK